MLLRNLGTRENDCTNGKTRTLQKQALRKVLVYRPIFERYQGWVALGAAFGILQGLLSASASFDYVSDSTMAKTHAALTLPAGVIGFLAAPKMGEIYHVPPSTGRAQRSPEKRRQRETTPVRGQRTTSPVRKLIRLQPFGNTGHGPVPRRRGDESEHKTGSPHDAGMIDAFCLWGSSRCRQMGVTLSEGGVTWKGDMILTTTTLISQRAEPTPLWSGLSRNAASDAGRHGFLATVAEKQSEAAPRVSPSPSATARRTRGVLVVRATPPFWPLVRHGGGKRVTGKTTPFPPLAGRSLSPQ